VRVGRAFPRGPTPRAVARLACGAVAPAGAHNRIAATGNTVADCPLPGILVTSTEGLTLDGNALRLSSDRRIAPWAIGRFRIVTLQQNEELGEKTLLERSVFSPKPPLSQEL